MMLGPSLLDRILELTRWHIVGTVAGIALVAWLAELVLRRRWSPSRRRLMEAQLHALRSSLTLTVGVRIVAQALEWVHAPAWLVIGAGFVAIVAWMSASLRVARVFVFQWLFARSEREGVPVLLVDIFTVAASVVIFGVLLHAVFLIEVTSLLATSAVLSVVLGLALQDTLGQLLAGISLQLDRPFRLGDWVEVDSGTKHIGGQVLEVSWRATLLLAIGEELVTIPNKTMAQGLVFNFSGRERPFVRGYFFRVPLDADLALVKRLLTQAALETKGIRARAGPRGARHRDDGVLDQHQDDQLRHRLRRAVHHRRRVSVARARAPRGAWHRAGRAAGRAPSIAATKPGPRRRARAGRRRAREGSTFARRKCRPSKRSPASILSGSSSSSVIDSTKGNARIRPRRAGSVWARRSSSMCSGRCDGTVPGCGG